MSGGRILRNHVGSYNVARFIQREHVTTFFQEHPEGYRISKIPAPYYLKNKAFRLTVDTAEDFALMENIYGQFYKLDSIVDLKKVIPYLESHPEVARLNSNVVQKDWRIEELHLPNYGIKLILDKDGNWHHADSDANKEASP